MGLRAAGTLSLPSEVRFGEICGLGIVDVCRNCSFVATRIGVFVGHVWLLFVLFQLARGTRRRRNSEGVGSGPVEVLVSFELARNRR